MTTTTLPFPTSLALRSHARTLSKLARFVALLAILLLFGSSPSRAIVFDFDAGYTAGDVLEGQPSTGTEWTRSGSPNGTIPGSVMIEGNNVGVDRNQAAVTQVGSSTVNGTNYFNAVTSTDLGGTFSVSSSIIDYSINLALQLDPTTSTTEIFSWGTGSPNGALFEVFANGTVDAMDGNGTGGGTLIPLKTALGGSTNFKALGGVYFTISGQINYATKTYTVFLDGVQQTIGGATASVNFPFFNTDANSAQIQMTNKNCDATGWIPVAISHFRYELDPVWSGPIVITTGGTYTGFNWAAPIPAPGSNPTTLVSPVIIDTLQAVTLTNCRIKGAGNLITNQLSYNGGSQTAVNLTVNNCKGYGYNPNWAPTVTGTVTTNHAPPNFIWLYRCDKITATNNYMEGTQGIAIFNGTPVTKQTVKVTNNSVFNIDARISDGNGGYLAGNNEGNFCQIYEGTAITGGVIAWNKVVEVPNESDTEDTINMFEAGGTSASPFLIYDNYIQGDYYYPIGSTQTGGGQNSSTGITLGDGKTGENGLGGTQPPTSYVSGYNNVVINGSGSGMSIFDGINVSMTDNWIEDSEYVGIDTIIRAAAGHEAGINAANFYGNGHNPDANCFENVTVTGNECGWYNSGFSIPSSDPLNYDYDFISKIGGINDFPTLPSNTWDSGTTALENDAANSWYSAVSTGTIQIGPNW